MCLTKNLGRYIDLTKKRITSYNGQCVIQPGNIRD